MNLADYFKGSDCSPELDGKRLTGQIRRIHDLMKDGRWRTLAEIEFYTSDPQASISAQLRNLRKKEFGSHIIVKRRRGEPKRGLWEYRMAKCSNGETEP